MSVKRVIESAYVDPSLGQQGPSTPSNSEKEVNHVALSTLQNEEPPAKRARILTGNPSSATSSEHSHFLKLPEAVLTRICVESGGPPALLAFLTRLGKDVSQIGKSMMKQKRDMLENLFNNPSPHSFIGNIIIEQKRLREQAKALCENLPASNLKIKQHIAEYKRKIFIEEPRRYQEELDSLKNHLARLCHLLTEDKRKEIDSLWETDPLIGLEMLENSLDHHFVLNAAWMRAPENQRLIQNVQSLNLSFIPDDKKLSDIPEGFEKFSSLKRLNLSNNALKDSLELNFKHLTSLTLRNNLFVNFTLTGDLPFLSHLDLDDNQRLETVSVSPNTRFSLMRNPALRTIYYPENLPLIDNPERTLLEGSEKLTIFPESPNWYISLTTENYLRQIKAHEFLNTVQAVYSALGDPHAQLICEITSYRTT